MKYTYYRRKKRIKYMLVVLALCLFSLFAAAMVRLLREKNIEEEQKSLVNNELASDASGTDYEAGISNREPSGDPENGENGGSTEHLGNQTLADDKNSADGNAGKSLYFLKLDVPPAIEALKYADIRILYPDGTSYMVVSDAERPLADTTDGSNSFWLSEEELLRLLSAMKDVEDYPGSCIFATLHQEKREEIPDYTPSAAVIDRITADPNIETILGRYLDKSERETVEERIFKWRQQSDFGDGIKDTGENFEFSDSW